jgi:hypothetical protein
VDDLLEFWMPDVFKVPHILGYLGGGRGLYSPRDNFYKLLREIEYEFLRHLKYLVEIEEHARIREKRLVEAEASPSIIVSILRFSNSFAYSTKKLQVYCFFCVVADLR